MPNQTRTSRVLLFLVISMTAGAFVLMALDNKPISAGAFSLTSYTRLNPVEEVMSRSVTIASHNWNRIEITYSDTRKGDIDYLARLDGLISGRDLNFHFVICNGSPRADGLIQAAEKWQLQRPALPGGNWYGSSRTIRICVIAGPERYPATDSQMKRTTDLVTALSRKFDITPNQTNYPYNWQL